MVILVALQSIGVFLYLSSIASNTKKSNDLLENVNRYIGQETRKRAYFESQNNEAMHSNSSSEIGNIAKAIGNIKKEIDRRSIMTAIGAKMEKMAESKLISAIGCSNVEFSFASLDVEIGESTIEIEYGKCPKKLSKKIIALHNFAKELNSCN